MNQTVSHPGHILPWNISILRSDKFRNILGGFTDNSKLLDDDA